MYASLALYMSNHNSLILKARYLGSTQVHSPHTTRRLPHGERPTPATCGRRAHPTRCLPHLHSARTHLHTTAPCHTSFTHTPTATPPCHPAHRCLCLTLGWCLSMGDEGVAMIVTYARRRNIRCHMARPAYLAQRRFDWLYTAAAPRTPATKRRQPCSNQHSLILFRFAFHCPHQFSHLGLHTHLPYMPHRHMRCWAYHPAAPSLPPAATAPPTTTTTACSSPPPPAPPCLPACLPVIPTCLPSCHLYVPHAFYLTALPATLPAYHYLTPTTITLAPLYLSSCNIFARRTTVSPPCLPRRSTSCNRHAIVLSAATPFSASISPAPRSPLPHLLTSHSPLCDAVQQCLPRANVNDIVV